MFHYTVTTNQSVEATMQQLEAQLKKDQFGVLWHLDLPETLQKKGVDFDQPYRILEVCNPREAKNILMQNKLAGYFLPCKIVLYEENGKTNIGMPRPTKLIEMLEDTDLHQFAEGIEKRLIACIDSSI